MAEHPRPEPHRLLVLGAGAAQLGLLEAAAARPDVSVVAADRNPLAPGFSLADERAVISTEDEPAIERLARARDVHGIVSPGADWPVGVAARIAERLGLPHPIDGATAAIATSKTRQRERFAAAGVLQPRTFGPGEDVPLPCVVKAADRQGQRGLTLVRDRRGLDAAVRAAADAARAGGVLVEELIDGPEITVNAVSVDGLFVPLTVTDRLLAEQPAFGVALAHVWPSAHATEAVVEAAAGAVAALGIENGPTYTQIRLDPDGRAYVMEVAARLGGGHDAELCRAVLGVDLAALAVAFALGEAVDVAGPFAAGTGETGLAPTDPGTGETGLAPTDPGVRRGDTCVARAGGGCVLFLTAPEGELREVGGVDDALAVPGVEWVRTYRAPGWRFGPLLRGADRAGAVLAVGGTREEAVARARRAAEAVRFQVDAA